MLAMMTNVGLLLAYVLTSTAGLLLMKRGMAGAGYLSGAFGAGLGFYLAGFVLWMLMIQRLPLSTAFPVSAGALIVATQIAGVVWLGEKMQGLHIAGSVLILAGLGVIYLAGLRD